ncbi:MAG: zinc ribbon domain-containing protein [Candidatus Bathyarchaeia archaeon]
MARETLFSTKDYLLVIALTIIFFSVPASTPIVVSAEPNTPKYLYFYEIDGDGNAAVRINFLHETSKQDSSWLIVPSFVPWINDTIQGKMLSFNIEPVFVEGKMDPFWKNYSFAYEPTEGIFNLTISFRIEQYAYIIEPNGFFLSSQIGYSTSAQGSTIVLLSQGARVSSSGVRLIDYSSGIILSPSSLRISSRDGRIEVQCATTYSSRLAIYFTEPGKEAEIRIYTLGRFSVQTASRYEDKAWKFLKLYNESYPILADIFGVSLNKVNVTLFIPTMDQFLSGLGGFVPFSETSGPGFVNLNMFYFRKVSGFIEIIALHELIHHFVWAVGFSPRKLWVHEGMAEYFSIELARLLGFKEGAQEHEDSLLAVSKRLGNALGFVQDWGTYRTSGNTEYYAASWKIFKTLGDAYGGLEYYKRFFMELKSFGKDLEDSAIVTALGLAAGDVAAIFEKFQGWGFQKVVDVTSLQKILKEARERAFGLSVFLQPSKALADLLLRRAEAALKSGDYNFAIKQVEYALFFVTYAFQVSLLTLLGATLGVVCVYWYLRLRKAVVKPSIPYYPMPSEPSFCFLCGARLPPGAIYCPECGRRQR